MRTIASRILAALLFVALPALGQQQINLTSQVRGVLPLANGGTNNTTGTATVNANLTGPITSTGNATAVASQTGTGSKFVMDASPTITTPAFSGTATGSISGNAATVTTNANLTGPITSSGNATSIASQTGTGTKFVVDTSPTLVTPTLGAANATSINFGGNALSAYTEGAWTPIDSSGGGLAMVNVGGSYTRIGRMVFWQATFTWPATADVNNARIGGLPFNINAGGGNAEGRSGANINYTSSNLATGILQIGATSFYILGASAVNLTNAQLSGKSINASGFYFI